MDFLIYRIYYDELLVYVGQTAQAIERRMQKHFFAPQHIRKIDPRSVSKIEVTECRSRADMNVYERYYIELLKPPLNCLEKDVDELTVRLPDLIFQEVTLPLLDKWREKIEQREKEEKADKAAAHKNFIERQNLRRLRHTGELSEDEYYNRLDALKGDTF